MHHLVLGLDPTELGGAPFALVTDEARRRTRRASWSCASNAGARVYVLPLHRRARGRRHRGDDPGRGAARPRRREPDRGRRHERRDRPREPRALLAASSPTGPAFEGAQISARPAGGARRDRAGPHRPRDARAALPGDRQRAVVGRARLRRSRTSTGICGSGIIEAIAELFLAGVLTADGMIDGAARRTHAARDRRRPHVRLRAPRRPAAARPSRRTTSGRSSSRRRPSTPAAGC